MRTTVQLPPELLRAAKAEAAARGETLKDFLTRAVAHELGTTSVPTQRARVKLPLVHSSHPGSVSLTNLDVEELFSAEDAEKHAGH